VQDAQNLAAKSCFPAKLNGVGGIYSKCGVWSVNGLVFIEWIRNWLGELSLLSLGWEAMWDHPGHPLKRYSHL
jgi:hypothetical protein